MKIIENRGKAEKNIEKQRKGTKNRENKIKTENRREKQNSPLCKTLGKYEPIRTEFQKLGSNFVHKRGGFQIKVWG